MNYNQAINILTSQGKFYINLGLDRMKSILKLLNNPQNKIKIIHVAGTNGKGSVCAIGANILKEAGYKTGLYTSPHLTDYTERIKINNKEIKRRIFAEYISKICEIAERNKIELTEFEIITASAYKYFAQEKVDIAFIETGLGGRYDATNAIESDEVSIITSISLDHTDRLGNTIDKIAYEKAGIIKPNSAVIISKENKGYKVIREQAKKVNSQIITVEKDIEVNNEGALINNKEYEFPLKGMYQKQNLALVMKLVEYLNAKGIKIPEKAIKKGLRTVEWKARFQYIKERNMIIDGAHNPEAAYALRNTLDLYYRNQKRIYIYGTIDTKNYKEIAKILFKADDEIYYYEFNHKNAVSYEEYKNSVNWIKEIKNFDKEILERKELKILTGSLYMIGEFYQELKDKRSEN